MLRCLQERGRWLGLWLLLGPAANAQIDSIVQLKEVRITGLPEQKPTPVQTIGAGELEKLSALQLSDAVKHFAGVTVKDYGGIGGLKTVSIRGLGANHTGVSYDGVTITDSQTGQIDLGKLSIDNVEYLSLSNGGPDDIFQPARAFSSASLLSIQTLRPSFAENQRLKAQSALKIGSFGLLNPTFLIQHKVSKHVATTLNGEWQKASGKFPYVLDYGGITSREQRSNTDVASIRGEATVYANLFARYTLSFKTYYYQSERGLPGATIYYNPHSSQRLWDRNLFFQTKLEAIVSPRVSTVLHAKYTSGWLRYQDPDYLGSTGKLENIYTQQESYLSLTGLLKATPWLQLSAASDLARSTMDANLYRFAYPTRYTWLSALNGKATTTHVTITGTVLATLVTERVREGTTPGGHQKISPALTIGYQPGNGRLLLRAFYKDIFRMPTFNDLYYTGVGNTKLQPESAQQVNLGITYFIPWHEAKDKVYFSTDWYSNQVRNKIVALPTKNLFIWSMMNLGKVQIKGMDCSLKADLTLSSLFKTNIHLAYSFQKVLDRTDPAGKTYGDQLAYTPVHSGSGSIELASHWFTLNYQVLFAGNQYILNHNIAPNYLKGYSEHGLAVSKKLVWGKVATQFKVDLLNVLNTQYEIVKNFPMPGRSIRLTCSARLYPLAKP